MAKKKRITVERAKKLIARMTNKQCQYVVRSANDSVIRRIAAAVKAARYRPLSSTERRKLVRHRKTLHILADPRVSVQSKRKAMMRQKGGALLHTLSNLAPLMILSLLGGTMLTAMGRSNI